MTCVFCPENWGRLNFVEGQGDVLAAPTALIHPLDPVTEGHVLAIHRIHTASAAVNPRLTAEVMQLAAWHVKARGIQANIITSVGPDATQTVGHTHLHIVPRRPNDDLPLPWTPQQQRKALRDTLDALPKRLTVVQPADVVVRHES